jgi:hypothetical protein
MRVVQHDCHLEGTGVQTAPETGHGISMLRVLQHNCRKSGAVLAAVMETGKERGSDVVLIQEPPMDQRYTDPTFEFLWTEGRTMLARRKESEWTFSTEDNLSCGSR